MSQLILIIHVLAALSLIALVLLQHGKGADAGAAFGSGASNTMFGSAGSMPFLMKLTALLAIIFFATSIGLSYLTTHAPAATNDFYQMQEPQKTSTESQTSPVSITPSSLDISKKADNTIQGDSSKITPKKQKNIEQN